MQTVVIFGILVGAAMAQRPSFAGSSAKGYPELASRFRDTESEASSTVSDIVNRLGVDATSSTMKIPVDARGDEELVKRLQQWPRENQPFWLINSEHIESHRNPQGKQETQQIQPRGNFGSDHDSSQTKSATPVPQRSSFLGARKTR